MQRPQSAAEVAKKLQEFRSKQEAKAPAAAQPSEKPASASPPPPQFYQTSVYDAVVGPYGLKLILWASLQAIFATLQFGVVFFILSALYFMYATMENNAHLRKKGQLSAYSVFNKGVQRIDGTFDVAQFERELRCGTLCAAYSALLPLLPLLPLLLVCSACRYGPGAVRP